MRTRLGSLLGATAVLVGACGGAGSPTAVPTSTPSPSQPPIVTPAPTSSATPTPPPATAAPTPNASDTASLIASASLPIEGGAGKLAFSLAAGPDAGLFVAISTQEGTVLASIDAKGRVRSGWPVLMKSATGCTLDADMADGSVRAVCSTSEEGPLRAFALGASGRLMAGWPVELPAGGLPSWRSDAARVVDGDLLVVLTDPSGDAQAATLVRVSRDGSLRVGVSLRDGDLVGCCAAVGPDGAAYLVAYVGGGQPGQVWQTMLSGLTLDGLRPGYPLKIDGSASVPAFGADGRIYVAVDRADYTVETGSDSSSQVLAIEGDGRVAEGWPVELPIDTGFGDSEGIGAPLPPLAAPGGSVTVVAGSPGGTVAYAIDPTGVVRAGWPFRSGSRLVAGSIGVGGCPSGCGMCGLPWAGSSPRVARDGGLYVAQGTRGDAYTGGNRIIAVSTDGDVKPGWPVTLREKGAWFLTFAVGDRGIVFGYAIEPAGTEPDPDFGTCKVFSGTLVALDGHGDPIYTTTLVVP